MLISHAKYFNLVVNLNHVDGEKDTDVYQGYIDILYIDLSVI